MKTLRVLVLVVGVAAALLPAAAVAEEVPAEGLSISTPDGSPVVAEVRVDKTFSPQDVVSSAPDTVSLLAFARPDGTPLMAIFIDPSMDAYDAPDQLYPSDVPSVVLNAYLEDYNKTIPPGDYLLYAAGQRGVRLTLTEGPATTLDAEPTDRLTALFNVVTPQGDVNPILESRLPMTRGPESVSTSFGLVALENHQASRVDAYVARRGQRPVTGEAYGFGANAVSPAGLGNGHILLSYSVFPGDYGLDNAEIDAGFEQKGVMDYHRATAVGLTFHVN